MTSHEILAAKKLGSEGSLETGGQLVRRCVRLLACLPVTEYVVHKCGNARRSSTLPLLVASLRTRTLHWLSRPPTPSGLRTQSP